MHRLIHEIIHFTQFLWKGIELSQMFLDGIKEGLQGLRNCKNLDLNFVLPQGSPQGLSITLEVMNYFGLNF